MCLETAYFLGALVQECTCEWNYVMAQVIWCGNMLTSSACLEFQSSRSSLPEKISFGSCSSSQHFVMHELAGGGDQEH